MELAENSYESNELNWQLYSKAGNQQMQAKLYQEAQQTYQLANDIANRLLEEAKQTATHCDAIHPYVVSCHNLADCFLQMGNAQQAEVTLQQGYNTVLSVMNEANFAQDLRSEAFQALKMISLEMHRFYQEQGQVTSAENVMQDAVEQAKVFLAQLQNTQTQPDLTQIPKVLKVEK
ncbi:MAG: hypothetical protein PUP91_13325 [Rhizonema sp. PD37]|nr:hypothetical protein [Rhizonema sp. PD37]